MVYTILLAILKFIERYALKNWKTTASVIAAGIVKLSALAGINIDPATRQAIVEGLLGLGLIFAHDAPKVTEG